MENKPDSFKAADGKKLFFQSWTTSEKPRLIIALVHGLGEHSGRYGHWAERFGKEDMVFASFDLRGHGLSEGKKGNIFSMEVALDDITFFLDKIDRLFPGIPVVLYGHSLGGNLAVNYVLRGKSDIKGLIVTSPWLMLSSPPPKVIKVIINLLGSFLPEYTRASGLDTDGLCHDRIVIEKYKSDPLVHDRISAGLFLTASQGGKEAIARSGDISLPVLIMHGTDDRITSPEGSIVFRRNAGDNITLKLWEGYKHELHNEPEKEEVFKFIINYLLSLNL